jgi:transcriptional repressor NrdR
MKCPFCQVDNDRVTDTRICHDGFAIRRRRFCTNCHRRYTTYEQVEQPQIKVVKKDGNRVPYEREKIRQGLEKACWKRPISAEQIDAIVRTVETEVHDSYDTEIPSNELGEIVMRELKKLDQVAYVRFASVYRDFADARAFVQEVEPMLKELRRKGRGE